MTILSMSSSAMVCPLSYTYHLAGRKIRFRFSDPFIGKILQAYYHLAQTPDPHDYDLVFNPIDSRNLHREKITQSAHHYLKQIEASISLQPAELMLKFWDAEYLLIFSPTHKLGCCLYPADIFARPESTDANCIMIFENTFDDTQLTPCAMSILKAVDALLEAMGIFSLHAGFTEIYGQYVLLPGKGATGKTTTALNIALNGGRLLADDRVFWGWNANRAVSVWPFPKKVTVTDSTIDFFPQLAKHRTNENRYHSKYYFTLPDSLDPPPDSGCEPNIVFFPHILTEDSAGPIHRDLSFFECFSTFLNGKILYPPFESASRKLQLDLVEALSRQSKLYALHLSADMERNFNLVSALLKSGTT